MNEDSKRYGSAPVHIVAPICEGWNDLDEDQKQRLLDAISNSSSLIAQDIAIEVLARCINDLHVRIVELEKKNE